MGYNGNNRGRTHNWSGVGNRRNYNWGLNAVAGLAVAPIVLTAALLEVASGTDGSATGENTKYDSRNNTPLAILRACENKEDDLHRAYRKVAFIQKDIRNIRRNIRLLYFNIFNAKKRIRKQKLLKYLIQRRERLIDKIRLTDYSVGKPVDKSLLKDKVTLHSHSQKGRQFELGYPCKKDYKTFHKYLDPIKTFSLRSSRWQMLFFTDAMFIQDKRRFAIIPYTDIKVKRYEIHTDNLSNTHGYEVLWSTWLHSRVDGGPDRRFNTNYQLYTIIRYQFELSFPNSSKNIYLICRDSQDAKKLHRLLVNHYSIEKKAKVPVLTDSYWEYEESIIKGI